MRRTKTVVLPNVDVMEPRLLLSTAEPSPVQARVGWCRSRSQGHRGHARQDGKTLSRQVPS